MKRSGSEYQLIRGGLWDNNANKKDTCRLWQLDNVAISALTMLWVEIHQQTIALVYVLILEWKILSSLCITLMDEGRKPKLSVFYLSIYLSICLIVRPSSYLSIHHLFSLSVRPSSYLSIHHPSFSHPSIIYQSIIPPSLIYLSVFPSVRPSKLDVIVSHLNISYEVWQTNHWMCFESIYTIHSLNEYIWMSQFNHGLQYWLNIFFANIFLCRLC